MHSEFRRLLDLSEGDSQRLVALNVDIRGFSAFSEEVESVLAALYIKKVYQRLLADYFTDADFFKPTGDGLLVVYGFTDDTLRATTIELVKKALKIVRSFPTLTRNDPAINFPVPRRVGIGLARGAGSRLIAGETILDYSGRTLNLASRLMDFARPEGVVLDAHYGIDLLPPAIRKQFDRTEVVIRGISEKELVPIYYTPALTSIPDSLRRPFAELEWEDEEVPLATLHELEDAGPKFVVELPSRPLSPSQLWLNTEFPMATKSGRKHKSIMSEHTFKPGGAPDIDITYFEEGGKRIAGFNADSLATTLRGWGVKPAWELGMKWIYPKD